MANAILMNGKASEPVEVANGIIEQFYSDTDVISAKNFIDFLNKGTFDIGSAISLASSNSSGLIFITIIIGMIIIIIIIIIIIYLMFI